MNDSVHRHAVNLQNQFGLKVAARLSGASANLPYDISEGLRAARMQALARRKISVGHTVPVMLRSGSSASLTFGDDGLSRWKWLASAVPLMILAIGLVAIDVVQSRYRVEEVVATELALLTDDLPPSAYADPGFVHFLSGSEDLAR
jgi:hypothetical protein